MKHLLEGFTSYREEDVDRYYSKGWWADQTFGDVLDHAAEMYPDKLAVVDKAHRLTYTQLKDLANKFAIALMDLPLAPAERVLLQLPNWYEFAIAYFGIQKAGAIDDTINVNVSRSRFYAIADVSFDNDIFSCTVYC